MVATTLVDVLAGHAAERATRVAFRFLADGEIRAEYVTYAELEARARAAAAELMRHTAPGDRVLLLHAPGLDYVISLFGCMYAGVVAVPAMPPPNSRPIEPLWDLIKDTGARVALGSEGIAARLKRRLATGGGPALTWVLPPSVDDPAPEAAALYQTRPDDLSVLQYTSGSTTTPKGVMLSHATLLNNVRMLAQHLGATASDSVVAWLPPYHDMGLIGAIFAPLFVACEVTLMSPAAFLQRPLRWLEAMARYGATISGGPNFGYDLCVRRTTLHDRQSLDLSKWRVAFSGAERVRADTLDRFASAFAVSGFQRKAFCPCYGLAEATLGVSFGRIGVGPSVTKFSEPERPGSSPNAAPADRTLVSAGPPLAGLEVVIVDPETLRRLPNGEMGEIWVRGPNVALGYWNRPELTESVFRAKLAASGGAAERYLRTGDLGFLSAGELYVTGRLKDLIVLLGVNHHPEDIEAALDDCHPAMRPSGCAAFAVEGTDREELTIVVEVDALRGVATAEVESAVRAALANRQSLPVDRVVIVGPGGIPRTSSGKVRRAECRALYLRGKLRVLAESKLGSIPPPGAPDDPKQTAAIASLMADLLGLESVAPDADFFALGGHSLLATQLVARVRDALEIELPLRVLFESPTARGISARLQDLPSESLPPISKRLGDPNKVLSFSQERMWFLQQVDPRGTAYNVAGGVIIDGPLDARALERALVGLISRYEILRTNYRNVGGRPEVVISPALPISLVVHDLSAEPDPEAAAGRLGTKLAQRPFDLGREPLVRGELYLLGPERHALVTSLHHVVTDGWSMGVLLSELLRRYTEQRAGAHAQPAGDAPSYLDYAAWQRRELVPRRLPDELSYWRKQLAGASLLELPTDRPRATRRSSGGAFEPFPLSDELVDSLRALGSRCGATLFMIMLAGFEVLLHRMTGSTDIVIGTPVANRTHLAAEGLVGTLVNTVALRARFDPERSFTALVSAVRDTALDAWAHQELPFERLVSELAVPRVPGRSPLFEVMFDYQNSPMPLRGGSGLKLRPLRVERAAAQFELSLDVLNSELGRLAGFEYSTALFDAPTIRRLAQTYLSILQAVARHPEQAVSRIELHSAEQERAIVALATRGTGAPLVTPTSALVEHAARTPHKVAVSDGAATLTYAELSSRVDALASRLIARGVGPGERVVIFLERSANVVVGLLASLRVGATYVPVDPGHPDARIGHVLADADPMLVVSERRLSARALTLASGRPCVLVDEPEHASAHLPELAVDWTRIAYILYTSGSTGRPKGVEVPLGALANFLGSMRREPGIGPDDRLLSVTTVAFDIAALELLLPLTVGAELHVTPADVVADGQRLRALLESRPFTLMQATPSAFRLLLAAGLAKNERLTVLVGGEPLDRMLATQLLERFPRVFNMYGPTETTVWSSVRHVTDRDDPVPIGSPIDRTGIYILDRHLTPTPLGVAGEICIGGAGVASGYFRNPELTADKFVLDPFATEPLGFGPARMYRTGDIGRLRADGVLECFGRVDQQVKIRGHRVELGEIESALRQATGVRDAAVVCRAINPGEMRLTAFYTVGAAEPPDPDRLRAELRRALPEYMVPASFVRLETIPLTPNGKVDRSALPVSLAAEPQALRPHVPPRTPSETALAELWAEVLDIETPSVNVSFFDLGGHSLLALRLLAAVEQRTGVALQVSVLIEEPTIEQLARLLDDAQATPASGHGASIARTSALSFLVPIQARGKKPPLFCVHGAGGNVLNLHSLAQRLGTARPFFGIQAAGVDGVAAPFAKIEEMADAYLREVLQVQPHGPYYLSGYCGGGIVAFEMAQRLLAGGEQVALLALLDAFGPGMPIHVTPLSARLQAISTEGVGYLWRGGKRRFFRHWQTLMTALLIHLHRLFKRTVPLRLREYWLMAAFLRSVGHYRARPYPRRLTVLRASDSSLPKDVGGEDLGWGELSEGGLDLYEVPGDHRSFTDEPNVSQLALTLGRCIGQAEGEQTAAPMDTRPGEPAWEPEVDGRNLAPRSSTRVDGERGRP